jgi:hypothetical protein
MGRSVAYPGGPSAKVRAKGSTCWTLNSPILPSFFSLYIASPSLPLLVEEYLILIDEEQILCPRLRQHEDLDAQWSRGMFPSPLEPTKTRLIRYVDMA